MFPSLIFNSFVRFCLCLTRHNHKIYSGLHKKIERNSQIDLIDLKESYGTMGYWQIKHLTKTSSLVTCSGLTTFTTKPLNKISARFIEIVRTEEQNSYNGSLNSKNNIKKKKHLLNYICYETDNGDKDGSTSLFSVINDPMILQRARKISGSKTSRRDESV